MPRPTTRPRPGLLSRRSALFSVILLAGCATTPPDDELAAPPTMEQARAAFLRQDYGTAADLLEPLAIGGVPSAQYALGYLYFYGRGLPRSERKAMAWFDEAARSGDAKARLALEMLSGQQDPKRPAAVSRRKPAPAARPELPEEAHRAAPQVKQGATKPEKTSRAEPSAHTYTVQLLGSRSLKDLQRLARRHGLIDASRYYQAGSRERPWYRLLYGEYPTVSEARDVLRALPKALKRHRPWVRNYPDVPRAAVRRFQSVLADRS